mmetsp:Transcript_9917/g.21028  ORF Transcript_9917/g.21028 Transcript_9917/m.21028 type:complete len:125 (+) Transcript_9917:321-695(+)
MAVMTNACQYFYRNRPRKPGLHQWAPFVLMVCSTVLLLASPLKNLVVSVCMASYKQNGFDATIEHALNLAYMRPFGTRLMQAYTLVAYGLMMWGTMLQMDFVAKVQESFASKAPPPTVAGAEAH